MGQQIDYDRRKTADRLVFTGGSDMTERYMTLTALHFTCDGQLMGKGCAITTGTSMEEALQNGAVQMGTIEYTKADGMQSGWFSAKLEQYPEMALRLTGNRFALVGNSTARKSVFRRIFGLG